MPRFIVDYAEIRDEMREEYIADADTLDEALHDDFRLSYPKAVVYSVVCEEDREV